MKSFFRQRVVSRGFTLLEVLIAVVVLSIGLLGIAALQFSSLRGNSETYANSQVHILGAEILDIMRAHRAQAIAEAFVGTWRPSLPPVAADCEAIACTPAQSARYALRDWLTRFDQAVPGGLETTVAIQCSVDPCVAGAKHNVRIIARPNRDRIAELNIEFIP